MKEAYAKKLKVSGRQERFHEETQDSESLVLGSADASAVCASREFPPVPPFSPNFEPAARPSSATTHPQGAKFADMPLSELLFIEIFAGTARLSAAFRGLGFQAVAVDKSQERSASHIALYDVCDDQQLEMLVEFLDKEQKRIVAVHFAPACGTASKAREKRLPKFAKKGIKVPQPLRSESKPMGLDKLSGLDKIKTEKANQVYSATAVMLQKCIDAEILASLENPANSLFWHYPDIRDLLERFPGCATMFHNCSHGGNRNKLTKWWATKPCFESLGVLCAGTHKHASWAPKVQDGRLAFPTADEAAYPQLLCSRVAGLVLDYAVHHGAKQVATLEHQVLYSDNTSHRWLFDSLPRGKKLKPLVSEFQSYVNVLLAPDQSSEDLPCLKSQPKGARIVHRQLQWGFLRVEGGRKFWVRKDKEQEKQVEKELQWVDSSFLDGKDAHGELCSIGIPREPWDFVRQAWQAGHPRSLSVHLPKDVCEVLMDNFASEPHKLLKTRATYLWKWTKRCKELEGKETELHASLPEHLKQVLKGKRLLLLAEMLEDLDYPDKKLASDIKSGFKLVGWQPKSNVFPLHTKRPEQTLEAVKAAAKGVNKAIRSQVAKSASDELNGEVWNQTLEEVSKGWIWIDEECDPDSHLLAKRFGLRQGEKVRLIDDCSIGGLNSTCGTSEKLRIHAIDEITSYLAWCLANLPEGSLSKVHPQWNSSTRWTSS